MNQEPQPSGISQAGIILLIAAFLAMLLHQAFHVTMGWLLSPEEYGELGVAMATMLILGFLLQFGFPQTVARFIASNREQAPGIFKKGLLANSGIGILLAIVIYMVATFFLPLEQSYQRIIPLLAISPVIMAIGFVFRYALQGTFRFAQMGIVDVFQIAVALILASILVIAGLGTYGAVIGVISGQICILILALIFLRGTNLLTRGNWDSPAIYNFAGSMLLGNLAITLILNVDILGVKFLAGPSELNDITGYYRSASILGRIPFIITVGLMGAAFAFLARASSPDEYNTYVRRVFKYSLVFCFPAVIAFIVIPESMLNLFFPPEYVAASSTLRIVALGLGFLGLIQILTQTFQARGMTQIPVMVMGPAFLLQLLLIVTLTPSFGMNGAAVATTFSCILGFSILLGAYKKKEKINLGLPLMRILCSYAILGACMYLLPHSTRVSTVLNLALAGIIYTIVLVVFRIIVERDLEIISLSLPNRGVFRSLTLLAHRTVKFLNRY